MKSYQKEVLGLSLEAEKQVLSDLQNQYSNAQKDIKARIRKLLSRKDANTQYVQNQVKFLTSKQGEVTKILENLRKNQYGSINSYLKDSYEDGFMGTLYSLQKQGVPLVFPIDQKDVVRAIQTNTKLSTTLYKALDVTKLKNNIRNELAIGLAQGSSYQEIAKRIDMASNTGLSNAYRIARTEGARIGQESKMDAMRKSKDAGADVVKTWDSTLDSRTRPHHQELNGQTKGIEEPFEVAGREAMNPCGFGIASEDINCRCTVLEEARWESKDKSFKTKYDGLQAGKGRIVSIKDCSSYPEFKKRVRNVLSTVSPTVAPIVDNLPENLFPKVLAGVKRGNVMTFEEADNKRANPNFFKVKGCDINCQSCVVTNEARRRGFDVETLPNTRGSMCQTLATDTNMAWIDPVTGKYPAYLTDDSVNNAVKAKKFLNNTCKKGERYTMQFGWKGCSRSGHIVCIEKVDDGLRLFDPQSGAIYNDSQIEEYLKRVKFQTTFYGTKFNIFKLLRVDNMQFNESVVSQILKGTVK